jgi:hypothetical protein
MMASMSMVRDIDYYLKQLCKTSMENVDDILALVPGAMVSLNDAYYDYLDYRKRRELPKGFEPLLAEVRSKLFGCDEFIKSSVDRRIADRDRKDFVTFYEKYLIVRK